MRVIVDIGHPAHVHFFKNAIWNLEKKGHQVLVVSRDKDVVIELLNAYNIPHTVLSKVKKGKIYLLEELFIRESKLYKIARKFNPDLFIGILSPEAAHVAWALGKKSIIFNDTEHAELAQKMTYPSVISSARLRPLKKTWDQNKSDTEAIMKWRIFTLLIFLQILRF